MITITITIEAGGVSVTTDHPPINHILFRKDTLNERLGGVWHTISWVRVVIGHRWPGKPIRVVWA